MRPASRGLPSRPVTSSSSRQQSRSDTLSHVAARLSTPMYISDRAMLPEQETVDFVKRLLALPTLSGVTEEGLASTATSSTDGLVTDPDFPPTTSSLYPEGSAAPESFTQQRLVWRRVAGALYLPSGALPQILQGCVANTPFLGALAAVACYPDLLLDLIVSDDMAQTGCFTLQFFKHGCWHRVVIDNYLPCVEGEERLAFACSGQVGELWPSLLEKAYAKLHGSYASLTGGSTVDCLTDLTGGVCTKIRLDKDTTHATAGHVWHQLQSWLSEGAIVACKAKPSPSEEGGNGVSVCHTHTCDVWADECERGHGGVMQNLDKGRHRLLRLQCPWPCAGGGLWGGAWAQGSAEWQSSADAQTLAAQPLDPTCFWIHINDFVRAFNRVYVCRRFPSSWHQLTLHSGWRGPSAGGPYYRSNALQLPEHRGTPCPSSTWCCNPQFQLTVRRVCEVVVAVSQVDPRVEHRGHVRKSNRKRSIGMMVLSCPAESAGRVWTLSHTSHTQVVCEVPLSAGRELVASFRAEPGMAYVVVPYTGRAGEESAFSLRAYSGAPLEAEQLPSPLSLVLGGSWAGHLAGGPPSAPTWGSNPQYMICAPCRTQVVLSVTRLDIKYAVVKPQPSADQSVGLILCRADRGGSEGLAAHKAAIRTQNEVAAESGFTDTQEGVVVCTLEPSTPYVLVPCLASPGVEAPFELRLMSAVPLELVPLPELCSAVVEGEWSESTAGGCDLTPSWRKNPRYALILGQPCTLNIDDMVGFYVLQASDAQGNVKGDIRRAILAESTFATTPESSGEYELQATQAGVPYLIIPCKYGAGRKGRYRLAVSATAGFSLTPL